MGVAAFLLRLALLILPTSTLVTGSTTTTPHARTGFRFLQSTEGTTGEDSAMNEINLRLSDFSISLTSIQSVDVMVLEALLTEYLTTTLLDSFAPSLTNLTLVPIQFLSTMDEETEEVYATYFYSVATAFRSVILPDPDDILDVQISALENDESVASLQSLIDLASEIGTNVTVVSINVGEWPTGINVPLSNFKVSISGSGGGVDNGRLIRLLKRYLHDGFSALYPNIIDVTINGYMASSSANIDENGRVGFDANFYYELMTYFPDGELPPSLEDLLASQADLLSKTADLQQMIDANTGMGTDLVLNGINLVPDEELGTRIELSRFSVSISGLGGGLDTLELQRLLQNYLRDELTSIFTTDVHVAVMGYMATSSSNIDENGREGFGANFYYTCTAFFPDGELPPSLEDLLASQADLLSKTADLQQMIDGNTGMGTDLVLNGINLVPDEELGTRIELSRFSVSISGLGGGLDTLELQRLLQNYLRDELTSIFTTDVHVTVMGYMATSSSYIDENGREGFGANFYYTCTAFFPDGELPPSLEDLLASQADLLSKTADLQQMIDGNTGMGTDLVLNGINLVPDEELGTRIELNRFSVSISGLGGGLDTLELQRLLQNYLRDGLTAILTTDVHVTVMGYMATSSSNIDENGREGFGANFYYTCTAYFPDGELPPSLEDLLASQADLLSKTADLQQMIDANTGMGTGLVLNGIIIVHEDDLPLWQSLLDFSISLSSTESVNESILQGILTDYLILSLSESFDNLGEVALIPHSAVSVINDAARVSASYIYGVNVSLSGPVVPEHDELVAAQESALGNGDVSVIQAMIDMAADIGTDVTVLSIAMDGLTGVIDVPPAPAPTTAVAPVVYLKSHASSIMLTKLIVSGGIIMACFW